MIIAMNLLMKHSTNIITKVIKNLDMESFNIRKTKSGFLIQHIETQTQYLCHFGSRGFHPLRRYLQSLEIKI